MTTQANNTKVTDLAPAEATKQGLTYTDIKGTLRGYCYCCGRIGFKINKHGNLSRHGFTRPRWMGYTTASCSGSGLSPEHTLEIAIECAESEIGKLEQILSTDLHNFTIKTVLRQGKAKKNQYGEWMRERKIERLRLAASEAIRAVRSGERCSGYERDTLLPASDAFGPRFKTPTAHRAILENYLKQTTIQHTTLIAVRDAA